MAEVGTSKIRGGTGLHNKPAGCGESEAYAPGPDGEEEECSERKCTLHINGYRLFVK